VKKLENKKVAILVLAIAAALVISVGAAYAYGERTGMQSYVQPGTTNWGGMGPSMMGGSTGYRGMMGNGQYNMQQYMEECMSHYWNSTSP
jgi:hypothetical protein